MSEEPNKEVTEAEKKPGPTDDAIKATPVDLKRRYRVMRERPDMSASFRGEPIRKDEQVVSHG